MPSQFTAMSRIEPVVVASLLGSPKKKQQAPPRGDEAPAIAAKAACRKILQDHLRYCSSLIFGREAALLLSIMLIKHYAIDEYA